MEIINYLKINWSDISLITTVCSVLISLIAALSNSAARKRLDIAYFQLREIQLYASRHKQSIRSMNAVTTTEVIYVLDGYEGMAASGMHGIYPHSVEGGHDFFRKTYTLLLKIKKGLHVLSKKQPTT